jgi:transcription elongation factor GreA
MITLIFKGTEIMMPQSEHTSSVPSSTLRESATQFLISLSSTERSTAQQEVYKFIRWFGENRSFDSLTIPEVANYAEQITASTRESDKKLAPVKSFLTYVHKQGLIKTKLHLHIKVKKASVKTRRSVSSHNPDTIILSSQRHAELQTELTALINERPGIVEEIQKAASDKDFKENAPLEAAREQLGKLEARIKEIETTLKIATLMDTKSTAGHTINIGDTVLLSDINSNEQIQYKLVDVREADPSKGKISIVSPIGQALLGQKKGDKITVQAPAGTIPYKIEDIQRS